MEGDLLKKYGIRIVKISDKEYPANLKEIHNPPQILYVRGNLKPEDDISVAIVGARRCSEYGKRVTRKLASGIAEAKVTIISGLALGLDTIAHEEAVKKGSRTIAVLANGLDTVYPQANWELAEKISQNGALISEYPPGTEPLKQNFPARNRIISGLAKSVLITEATDKSGTLHTLNFALEQNRDVYAVPGPIDSPLSLLPNNLIKEGARPVTEASDILIDMGIEEVKPLPKG